MTLARRLRKWGGGGGDRFSPSFILRAWAGGRSGSVRLLTGGGRGWGAPAAARAPRGLLLPKPTPHPAHSVPFPQSPTARLLSRDSWAVTPERSESGPVGAGAKPGGFGLWQPGRAVLHAAHVGPISHAGLARRRSWSGGESREGGLETPSRSRGENHSAVKDARRPGSSGKKCAARGGEDAPSFAPRPCALAECAPGRGCTFEDVCVWRGACSSLWSSEE